jgi:uncharacterized protein (TIGR02001 family)
MKTPSRIGLLVTLLTVTDAANADWSANLGFASEYYFRGVFQESTSANGGVDFESGGFFVGTWAADVGDGLEVDGYFGYGFNLGEVDLTVGYTGYFYTGDFDDTYQEINLGAGFGLLTLDVAIGEHDNFDGPTQNYTFYSLLLEKNGFYGKYGGFAQDFEGEYFEIGYTTSISDVDVGLNLIFSNEDLVGEVDEAIVLTLSKSFGL